MNTRTYKGAKIVDAWCGRTPSGLPGLSDISYHSVCQWGNIIRYRVGWLYLTSLWCILCSSSLPSHSRLPHCKCAKKWGSTNCRFTSSRSRTCQSQHPAASQLFNCNISTSLKCSSKPFLLVTPTYMECWKSFHGFHGSQPIIFQPLWCADLKCTSGVQADSFPLHIRINTKNKHQE